MKFVIEVNCVDNIVLLPDWFQGYPTDKPVNPMYRTSNNDYGSKAPSVHTMPTMFFAKSQQFSLVNTRKFYAADVILNIYRVRYSWDL